MSPLLAGALASLLPLGLETGRNLEYEYATLVSIFSFVFALGVKDKKYFQAGATIMAVGLFVMTSWLLLGPTPCHMKASYFWYFVQVPPTVFLGLALRGRLHSHSLKSNLLLALLIFVSFLLFLWISPQKRWVSLWFGYLHGPVYDDFVPLTGGVILARLSHLVFAFYLQFRKSSIGMVAMILWGISLFDPINGHGKHALERKMTETLSGDHFSLHYSSENKSAAEATFKEASFHMEELTRILSLTPQKKIEIYLYSTMAEKKLLFGGAETDITDVVMPSVHILLESPPHSTLRHELVHGLLSEVNPLGFHWNMIITEGIAVALAPSDSSVSLDEQSRYLLEEGKMPPLQEMFGPLFWLKSSAVSYGVAGSLISWLIQEKGPEKFLKIYGGSSFEEVYGMSFAVLFQQWLSYLRLIPYDAPTISSLLARLMSSPSVFQEVCPHAKVDRRGKSAPSFLTSSFLTTSFPSKSEEPSYFEWLEKIHPESEVLRNERLSRKRKSETEQPNLGVFIPPVTLRDFEDALLETDLLCLNGHMERCHENLSLLSQIPLNPGRTFKRALELRRFTLMTQDSENLRKNYEYIVGRKPEQVNDSPVVNYLKRKNGLQNTLLHAFPPEFKELNREVWKLNASYLEKIGDIGNAQRELEKILTQEPESQFMQIEKRRLSFLELL